MRRPVRKALILTVKFVIALALLAWVFARVSWNDFVLDADGDGRVAATEVAESAEGLTLTLADGSTILRRWNTMAPVDPAAANATSNYVRPGFFSSVRDIRYGYVAGAMVCVLFTLFAATLRWQRLLAVQDIHISYFQAMRLTWMGSFFNYIVLGTTGGDLIKAYYVSRHAESKTACLVSVLVDRVVGMTGLALLSATMLIIVAVGRGHFDTAGEHSAQLTRAGVGLAILLVCLAAGAFFVFSVRLRRWLHLEKLYQLLPMSHYLGVAGASVGRYRRQWRSLVEAMGLTAMMHVAFVGGVALLGESLGLQIPWFQYGIHIPLIYIIAAVPIVPGGVGLTESFYVTFFAAWSSESQILALALGARLVPMFLSLPGVIVAVTGPKRPSTAEIEAEMDLG